MYLFNRKVSIPLMKAILGSAACIHWCALINAVDPSIFFNAGQRSEEPI